MKKPLIFFSFILLQPPTCVLALLRTTRLTCSLLIFHIMDRQALLEQKRQRLLELKSRRSTLALLPIPSRPTLKVAEKVDFSVQVGPIFSDHGDLNINTIAQGNRKSHDTDHATLPEKDLIQRFDKGVQTNFEDLLLPPQADEQKPEPETAVPTPEPTNVSPEVALLTELSKSNFSLSKIRLGLVEENSHLDIESTLHETRLIDSISRPATSTDITSLHPQLVLVSYGAAVTPQLLQISYLKGLVVVYNRGAEPMVPEFFLQCTSPVTVACFDQENPFRVYAGMENGRLAMWDLSGVKPTELFIPPTLQTSTVASMGNKLAHKLIHHTRRILRTLQFEGSIVTFSGDGVINAWSPNLLAEPRVDSVRLGSDRPKDQFNVSDALILSRPLLDMPNFGASGSKFLDHTVVASKSGMLCVLQADLSKSITRWEKKTEAPIVCLKELYVTSTTSLIISSHIDWTLRLWSPEDGELYHLIPVAVLVTRIAVRPTFDGQFVTAGISLPNGCPCLQVWNLSARASTPLSALKIDTASLISHLAFNAEGNELLASFSDGVVRIWEVNETRLGQVLKDVKTSGLNRGLVVV